MLACLSYQLGVDTPHEVNSYQRGILMWLLQVLNGLMLAVTIAAPIVVALVIVRAVRRARRARETFEEEARSLLGELHERQEETNRLLHEHLADDKSDTV